MAKVTVTVKLLVRARRKSHRKALIRRVNGIKQLNIALDEIKKEIVDEATTPPETNIPLLRAISKYLGQRAAERFEQSVGPDGSPWPKLRMSRRKPLMRSKRLYGAMKDPEGQAGGFFRMTNDAVEQGTTLFYSEWQQKGIPHRIYPVHKKALYWLGLKHPIASTSGIPARPFSGVNQADGDAVADKTLEYFTTGKVSSQR